MVGQNAALARANEEYKQLESKAAHDVDHLQRQCDAQTKLSMLYKVPWLLRVTVLLEAWVLLVTVLLEAWLLPASRNCTIRGVAAACRCTIRGMTAQRGVPIAGPCVCCVHVWGV